MKAGFAEVDITPAVGKLMPGGFEACVTIEPPRGRLKVTAMAVKSGERAMILVSADMLSMSVGFADGLRKRISKRTGVPTESILLAATHTHTGGALDYQLWLCPPDPEVARVTGEGIYQAARRAWENMCEAVLGVGKGEERRYSYCRDILMTDGTVKMNPDRKRRDLMVKPVTEPDYTVNVMRVDGPEGDVRAFIVNYANHPCCHGRDTSSFSADFPGALRRNLKRVYGEDVKVLFLTGAAGDINCISWVDTSDRGYYGPGKNAPEAIGSGLAATVAQANTYIDADIDAPYMDAVSENAVLERRLPTAEMVAWAKEVQENPSAHSGTDRAYALDYLTPAELLTPTVNFEVQTLRLGPWAIVGLPSEIFTDVGREIRERSPYPNTVVVELANGTHGYVATEYAHKMGVYETQYCAINACTAADSGARIVKKALEQLNAMAKKEGNA